MIFYLEVKFSAIEWIVQIKETKIRFMLIYQFFILIYYLCLKDYIINKWKSHPMENNS